MSMHVRVAEVTAALAEIPPALALLWPGQLAEVPPDPALRWPEPWPESPPIRRDTVGCYH